MLSAVNRVVFTGGPGAGKTSVLQELASMGYATVSDSARSIIAERLARGANRRPDPETFAREILGRDIKQYLNVADASNWVFFDRGVIDALGMLQDVSPLPPGELAAMLATYRFHASVFVFPPWKAIYTNDAERDQSFEDAVDVHTRVVRWYRSCGYVLHDVPAVPVAQRAEHVRRVLGVTAPAELRRAR
jgi:predicted ATPase